MDLLIEVPELWVAVLYTVLFIMFAVLFLIRLVG